MVASRRFRFGIKSDEDYSSATWVVSTPKRTHSDVYLACRELGGYFKASLHESGQWHVAMTDMNFQEMAQDDSSALQSRFMDKWDRPQEIAPGVTRPFAIRIPSWAVSREISERKLDRVTWIPNAPDNKTTEVQILLTEPKVASVRWPPFVQEIGSLPLVNGENLWVVYQVIDTPDPLPVPKVSVSKMQQLNGARSGFKENDTVRALAVAAEPDGTKVIYDVVGTVTRTS